MFFLIRGLLWYNPQTPRVVRATTRLLLRRSAGHGSSSEEPIACRALLLLTEYGTIVPSKGKNINKGQLRKTLPYLSAQPPPPAPFAGGLKTHPKLFGDKYRGSYLPYLLPPRTPPLAAAGTLRPLSASTRTKQCCCLGALPALTHSRSFYPATG